ncbi:MAG: type IV pilus assembly protein PilM [Patescibacteria group bacterium]|jgi:type IV pilus assembly protein PilM
MPIVGLNLGLNNFRAVEIEKSKGSVMLTKYGTYKNPRINLETDELADINEYASALDTFFTEKGFDRRNVIAGLPESQVFVRTIKLPDMNDKELQSSIQFEAEQYIPLPIKDVTLSFQRLDPDVTDRDKVNVLLVAAKKSVISKYIEVLKKANLSPSGLEPETLAMSRALGDRPDAPYATIIADINTSNTLLIVTYKGFVRLTRSLSVGGDVLTRAVQQALSLDYEQAEEYKKTYGLDNTKVEGKVSGALVPVFDNIIAEIKRSKVFFTTRNPNVKINKVIVSGGTALMPGLFLYMVNNLDVEVELANPWKELSLHPKIESEKDTLLHLGPVFVTPVGLALKEL